MVIDFPTIAMMYKLEAVQEDNPFTDEQRGKLISIMDKVEKLKPLKNPFQAARTIQKYKSLESQYIEKFDSCGGSSDRLNKTLRAYEDSNIPPINEFKEKFKERSSDYWKLWR